MKDRCEVIRVASGPGEFVVRVAGRKVDVVVDASPTEAYGGAKYGVFIRYPRRLGGPRLVLFDTRKQAERAVAGERTFGRNAPTCMARIKRGR
jgi:hypothetical protein